MFAVHYKFKSAKDDYSTITFDTPSISLAELKERILEQNNLKRAEDFDLKIVNSQTGEDYSDPKKYNDHSHIPKNTSVIVSRVPITKGRFGRSGDTKLNSGTGTNRRKPTRILGPDYVCHRCGGQGHFIHECPTNGNPEYDFHKVKKATGIPKTFLQPVSVGDVTNQTLRMANGGLAIMKPNEDVFEKSYKIHMNEDNLDIPNDYKCPLCKGVLRDPVLIPCCGYSFCSECISPDTPTDTLLCPTCKRVTHPSKFVKNKDLILEIEKWLQDKENGNASSDTSEQDKETDSPNRTEQEKEPVEEDKLAETESVDKVSEEKPIENEKPDKNVNSNFNKKSYDDYDNRKDRHKEYGYDGYRKDRYDDRYYGDYKRDRYDYKGKSKGYDRGYDRGDDYRKRERRIIIEDRNSRHRDDKYRSKYRDYDRPRERQDWKRERERSRYY